MAAAAASASMSATAVLIPRVPAAVRTTRCSALPPLPPRVSTASFSSSVKLTPVKSSLLYPVLPNTIFGIEIGFFGNEIIGGGCRIRNVILVTITSVKSSCSKLIMEALSDKDGSIFWTIIWELGPQISNGDELVPIQVWDRMQVTTLDECRT
ncbi:protein CURVATURE THYLAKOID 1A, chloroplastic-like [Gossypium australe]|uniref:Protein CURVATURE THYLAKOID 1A, chloroplastic-like n=1 Tax=Gossypium australe TaxID=47621 RepID=A0A5B6VKH9_9ROSI|nr:protein CURVATURE THYLAKOID 1A, chloroplastic-like [Gossypium australe]